MIMEEFNKFDEVGAADPNGNPYITWWQGTEKDFFDACEAAGIDRRFIRARGMVNGIYRTRFTAYKEDKCVTDDVFKAAKEKNK